MTMISNPISQQCLITTKPLPKSTHLIEWRQMMIL